MINVRTGLIRTFSLLTLILITQNANSSATNERESVAKQLAQIMKNGQFDNSQIPNRFSFNRAPKLPTPFIIGGIPTGRNAFPEYTLVIFTDGRGNVTGLCGGTLIASNKVLTAAHCSQNSASTYFLIPGFYSFNDNIQATDLKTVSSAIDHPRYNSLGLDFDIAVMTLRQTVSIKPAKVIRGSNQLVGRVGTVIGTGLTATTPSPQAPDVLLGVDAPIISNDECASRYQSLTGSNPITNNIVCAGFSDSGNGSCFGDSGGPLFVGNGKRKAIAGVVSFGLQRCEAQRATSAYARTTAFTDFIKSQSPNTGFVEANNFALAPIMMLLDEPDEVDLSIESLAPEIVPFPQGKYAIRMNSADGDTVGIGKSYRYDSRNSNFTIEATDDNSVKILFRGSSYDNVVDDDQVWEWRFARSGIKKLSPGVYRRANRHEVEENSPPFGRSSNQLFVSQFGRRCSSSIDGEFRILDIEFLDSKITKFVADFVQRCGRADRPVRPELIGSIIYDQSNPNIDPLYPSAEMLTPSPAISAPISRGANVEIRVDPIPSLSFNRESYSLSPSNSVSSVGTNFNTGLDFRVSDSVRNWIFTFAKPILDADPDDSIRLRPGIYRNTKERSSLKTSPVLYTSGIAYCGFLTQVGEFRVFDISYPEGSDIADFFILDFVMRCEDNSSDKLNVSIHYDNRLPEP